MRLFIMIVLSSLISGCAGNLVLVKAKTCQAKQPFVNGNYYLECEKK